MPEVFRLIAEHVSPDLVEYINSYVSELNDSIECTEGAILEKEMQIDEYYSMVVYAYEAVENLMKELKDSVRCNKDKVLKSLEIIQELLEY